MSVYAQGGSTGGSVYAQSGQVGGSVYAGGNTGGGAPAPAKHKTGGFLGAVEHVAHWTAAKAALAGNDLKAIPGGMVQLATPAAHEFKAIGELATGNVKGAKKDMQAAHDKGRQLGKGTIASTEQTVKHPLRDPFQTVLLASSAVSGGAGAVGKVGAVSKALDEGAAAGDVAKAALAKPAVKPRLISSGDTQVPLHASKNPAVRMVQAGYDRVIQKALDTNPEGRVAAHANRRLGGSIAETARYQQRIRDVPASMVEAEGRQLGPGTVRAKVSTLVPRKLQEAALRLASENSTPEEAAAFHRGQAEKGVSAPDNLKQAKLYDQVAKKNLIVTDEHGNAIINAADHPRLAQLDSHIAAGQDQVDKIAEQHGLMTREQLDARKNGPARIRNGAQYVEPTPGKQGVPSQGLIRQRAQVDRLQAIHDRATVPKPTSPGQQPATLTKTSARAERIGGALSVAKDRLQQMEAQAAARVEPTGIVGGEDARPGRGFVTYRASEPRAPKTPAASAASPVVGKVKSFIPKKTFTGQGLEHGQIPDNTSRLVAQNMRNAYRFVNSNDYRTLAAKTGSDTRRSSRDVLVLKQDATPTDIPTATRQLLGKEHSTLDELNAESTTLRDHVEKLVPGLKDNFAADRKTGIGVQAPDGYRWVDRGVLGDLAKPKVALPKGKLAHGFDNVNSAVTAATVYFKLGHVGTRVLTNAATNIIEGSATPRQIAKTVDLWHELTPLERQKALAASGQHGFAAMPHTDGTGRISHAVGAFATTGTNWWAKHADAPFRFNAIAYEARKAGFDTPAKFRDLLDKLENPNDHNMNAAEAAKVDWVAKRANRENIAYDRLSHFERTYITRALWFYPFTAGAVRFAVNTLLEHPYKSQLLGSAGLQGRKTQQAELGDLPSYEQGLFQLAGSATGHPLVADFSTFSPFSPAADALQLPQTGAVADQLNPGYSALLQLLTRTNQYGQHSNNPLGDALSSAASPTPEAQILSAVLGRNQDQSKRMFNKTPLNQLARAAVGPGLPRRINLAAAHSSAARERSGR